MGFEPKISADERLKNYALERGQWNRHKGESGKRK
jgi:hypothetical protein